MPSKKNSEKSGWSLYWVSSDGDEDCFVVARNSRSAARFEADYCGFDIQDLAVRRVKAIPSALLRRWELKRTKDHCSKVLPDYADRWLQQKLGAVFRERDSLSETLIDDVVYTLGPDGPFTPRIIGRKYVESFNQVKAFKRYGHEDRYSQSQTTLFTIFGCCVARVQEIEYLIAHSFILSAASDKERKKYKTIADLIEGWKRKTLGQMLNTIEDQWEIDSIVLASLKLFLEMRNKLVHGLTMSEQYDIHTSWGQDETIAFLSMFELISRPLRQAFRASVYASIELGNTYLLAESPERQYQLNKRQTKLISLFAAFFKLKEENKASQKNHDHV